mmetsp:Transcript_65188/g.175002  ORF Transcript_65188/g.175002 Transcript_65188/m.175002 type:complete len:114 (-) Transcript_65188:535-876(-)
MFKKKCERKHGSFIFVLFLFALLSNYEVSSARIDEPLSARQLKDGEMAIRFYDQGKYQEALSIFLKLKKQLPRNLDLLMNIGHCYDGLNDLDSAENFYRQAVKENILEIKVWS